MHHSVVDSAISTSTVRKGSPMKASLACLYLLTSLYSHAQQNATAAMALTNSSSLSPANAVVRLVSSVTEVNLLLTARRGRHLIDSLRPEDLEILDNGERPARVTHFESKTNLPLRLALLIDKSDSVRARFKLEQAAATEFLKRVLRQGDIAMIVGFNQSVQLAQEPTSDQRQLSQGIKRLKPGGDTALFDALSYAAQKLSQINDDGPVRRVIVLLSDGQENSSAGSLQRVINKALYAGTAIFSITSSEETICRGDRVCEQGETTLKSLSDSTGGEFLRAAAQGDLSGAFAKIRNELRMQYAVSYRPAFNAPDGQFHVVTVSANRGVHVHCRKGYYARMAASK
jgi:VWFA-related protein